MDQAAALEAQSWISHEAPDGSLHPLTIRQLKWMDEGQLERNVRSNILRDIPRLLDRADAFDRRNEPLAIVAGGPSLSRTLDQLREFKNVMAVASVHDHLSQAGIPLKYAVIGDGIATMADYLRYPQINCTYLLASQCDPSCFEAVEGSPVELWHYAHQVPEEAFGSERVLFHGASCMLIAMRMALFLGYQHFHFFGFDCAFGGTTHAYDMPDEIQKETIVVRVGDEQTPIRSDMSLAVQALGFFQYVRSEDGVYFHSTIHGGGLIAEMVRQGNDDMRQRVAVVDYGAE